jgi:outer membrane protein TolC
MILTNGHIRLMVIVAALACTARTALAQQQPKIVLARQSTPPQPGEQSPPAAAVADTGRLSLRGAIVLALKNNLGVRVAATQVDEAAGTTERKESALMPHVATESSANLQNRNLRAFGFSLPGIPLLVGPFSNYDFRFYVDQTVIDRQAYHTYQASKRNQDATKLTYQDTRDQVIRQAAAYYLDAQASASEVEAAEARVATSQALERLAQDQHAAGLATGVDVLRAQVQLRRDQQSVLVSRQAFQTALLVLQRYLGLRPGAPIELADKLAFRGLVPPEIDQARQVALETRADYRSLRAQREALVEQQKASHARYLPKLGVNGNYGGLGRNLGELPGTGLIQGTLSFTVFDRDRNGEAKELASRVQRVDAQMSDLERGIEQELRKAALDLESTEQQVQVTQAGEDLARSELKLAEDRFRGGVTDNIEVITAQSSLQSAQDEHILALARHADARMALARALGATEQIFENFLGPQ